MKKAIAEIIEEVAFRRMDCRIATIQINNGNSKLKTIQITHEAIAQELGNSREVVSRILKTFEKQELACIIHEQKTRLRKAEREHRDFSFVYLRMLSRMGYN